MYVCVGVSVCERVCMSVCVCVQHVGYLVDRTQLHRGAVETLSWLRMCLCRSS